MSHFQSHTRAYDRPQARLPCAIADAHSRGRVYPEAPDPLRLPFELDRHRVLTCTAFRRVRSKTQVFSGGSHDHMRTRLTHTLEVAESARLIASLLGVNAALAEVIALAHDLGHPPFGHAGEAALHERMRGRGGFEHNAQSLRVVDYLEHPFPAFRGLNLTFETREGLIKHRSRYDAAGEGHADPRIRELWASGPSGTVESQVADVADRLAYDVHDVEDAMGLGLLDARQLQETRLWRDVLETRPEWGYEHISAIRRPALDALQGRLMRDLLAHTAPLLAGAAAPDEVRARAEPVVAFPAETAALLAEFEDFLRDRVYRRGEVREYDEAAREVVQAVFDAFMKDAALLPPRFAQRIDQQGHARVICDYVAGMTDRFCVKTFVKITRKRPPGPLTSFESA